jgi:hypothetical protein
MDFIQRGTSTKISGMKSFTVGQHTAIGLFRRRECDAIERNGTQPWYEDYQQILCRK